MPAPAATLHDHDYVLGECHLDALRDLVVELEGRHAITMVKDPTVCLTMVRAEDSLDHQEFYLGEALTTECEVTVDTRTGYGLCLGDEPVRAYCLAVLDALLHSGGVPDPVIDAFVEEHRARIAERETEEFNLILRTHVDFKLMEEQ